jgi:hypothetical protein
MSKFKIFLAALSGLAALVAVAFAAGLFELGMFQFFAPKFENVRREVFEQTQSYTHGKIQDLAKYKAEYDAAESEEDRQAIRGVILMRFAEFDETKIRSLGLQQFLREMRGY